ncbi:hypothetical protein IFM89_005695 [Coptis chinensis]|uniref:Auxin-responsive protein n=1 Tax=Coptis chinensis TaxID=261450 RepID=A0A835H2B5_9MAGN|nr:hypothetical protein IFM89_005695 [Coptis chinensis]
MGRTTHSSSSSINSSSHPSLSSASSSFKPMTDISTNLSLGLSISTSSQHGNSSNSRNEEVNWPPIKPLLRSMLADQKRNYPHRSTFFVKVYMEGIVIGRKVDLYAHHNYDGLIRTLRRMFKTTTIRFPADIHHVQNDSDHLLTYEDKEGDWMMVGDVPWDLFLTSVKKLKISIAVKC